MIFFDSEPLIYDEGLARLTSKFVIGISSFLFVAKKCCITKIVGRLQTKEASELHCALTNGWVTAKGHTSERFRA